MLTARRTNKSKQFQTKKSFKSTAHCYCVRQITFSKIYSNCFTHIHMNVETKYTFAHACYRRLYDLLSDCPTPDLTTSTPPPRLQGC